MGQRKEWEEPQTHSIHKETLGQRLSLNEQYKPEDTGALWGDDTISGLIHVTETCARARRMMPFKSLALCRNAGNIFNNNSAVTKVSPAA